MNCLKTQRIDLSSNLESGFFHLRLWVLIMVASSPAIAFSSTITSYNQTQYDTPLTSRISLPAQWIPSVGNIGYEGSLDVMWYTAMSTSQDNALVSIANAKTLGAPSNFILMTGPDNCWGMLMNFGLITIGQNSDLIITVSADPSQTSFLAPALALYHGWDTGKSSSRHQTITFGTNNPLSTSGLSFVGDAYANNASNTVTRTFHNLSAGNYELFVTNRSNNSTSGGYAVSLKTMPAGTAPEDPFSQSELCASANNQRLTSIPIDNLCVYGASFGGLGGAPELLSDGRYCWACGQGAASYPSEMCYSGSTKNAKQNQAPLLLQPGSTKVAINQKVVEQASGGSGGGTLTFTIPGASAGIKCKLVKKGNSVTITAGTNQRGSCRIRATKSASKQFNSVQSVDYTVIFSD